MTETSDITRPLVDAIRGIPGCVAHRLHSGKLQVRGGWLHAEPEGTPDVLAILLGVPVYLETKVRGGRVSEAQAKAHRELERAGLRVHVVRSFAEGMTVVRQMLAWRGRKEMA